MIFEPEIKADALRRRVPGRAATTDAAAAARRLRASDAAEFVDALLDVDVNHYLRDCLLVKVDIATMAHGLEGRSPMLDHEFMEFAASLPADFKLRGTTTKYIFKKAPRARAGRHHRSAEEGLRRAARPLVPQRAARDERRRAALAAGQQRGYFKPAPVRRMLEEHWSGTASGTTTSGRC